VKFDSGGRDCQQCVRSGVLSIEVAWPRLADFPFRAYRKALMRRRDVDRTQALEAEKRLGESEGLG